MMTNLFRNRVVLILLSMLTVILVPANRLSASPDIAGADLVIDAPWRTVRDYLPVLFFTPEFKNTPYLKLNAFRLYNYDPFSTQQQTIFVDSRQTNDDLFDCAITFVGPDGEARSHLSETEKVDSFWHYIARVPVSCIGFGDKRGKPGEHFLRGEIHVSTRQGNLIEFVHHKAFHVLRVIVTPDGFAKFSPVDHQFDVHVHTIAEQTSWHGAFNVNAGKKAFGGPLAMLMESAYALGMVDVQLRNGNWSAFKNKIVTTDHNAYFSGNPYESGAEPGYGPTSDTNGEKEEFYWYRQNLGELGGEEITLYGSNGNRLERMDVDFSANRDDGVKVNIDYHNSLGFGSHLLSYGAPHFDGPWHGGGFWFPTGLTGVQNDNFIQRVIRLMGSENGFGYAAHPESSDFGWSENYYKQAIGFKPYNVAGDAILQRNQREFVFKGLQVWNEHNDMKSRESGKLGFDEAHRFDPHTSRGSGQTFVPNSNWRSGHDKTYAAYKRLLKKGLKYSFRGADEHIFIRKLYLSAGTDSHAAFNDDVSLYAAHLSEIASRSGIDLSHRLSFGLSANNNAFGRLRTYTLTSQRYIRAGASIPSDCQGYPFCGGDQVAPVNFPLEDYKEGNTVATDGPVGRFSTDANCRFNSDIHQLAWHDDLCIWENHDGLIGGRGKFDGGNTMLAPVGNPNVMMRYQWIGKNDYLPDSEAENGFMTFKLVRVNPNISGMVNEDYGEFRPGRSGRSNTVKINDILTKRTNIEFPDKSALILEGELNLESKPVEKDVQCKWPLLRKTEISEERFRCEWPYETKFTTNPIWVAPYKITIDPVRTCPIKPGQLNVTLEFGISMNTKLPSVQAATTDQLQEMAGLIIQEQRGAGTPATTDRLQKMARLVIQKQIGAGTPSEADAQAATTDQLQEMAGLIIQEQRGAGTPATTDRLQKMARLVIQKQKEAGVKFSKNVQGRSLDTPIIGQNSPGTPSEADADEDTYEGIRVVVKPLDRQGNSGERGYEISSQSSQWRAVEIPGEFRPDRIMDAKYTTSNSMTIPCGEGWNSANSKNNQDADWASYAVVVDQIYDMHMNYLNPIAKTVAMRRPASLSDPIIPGQDLTDELFVPKEKHCSASSKNLCRDYGASCEVTEPVNGAGKDLCRWPTANSASKCQNTVGIWTTAGSKYARNHPDAVPAGADGACITQVENIKNRIQ